MPWCGACEKGGHRTENCTGGEGKGKHWGLGREQGSSMEQGVAGDAFANSGTAYHSDQRSRTPSMEEPGPPVRSRSLKFIPQQEWVQKRRTEEGAKEMRTMAEAKTGQCPVCKEKHAYHQKLTWASLSWPSSRLHDCKAFQTLSPPQRVKVIQEQGGCVVCLFWAHTK